MEDFKVLNDEQILELCLIAVGHDISLLESYPGEFLTYYTLKNAHKEMSDDEIAEYISDLIVSHTMESLVRGGHLQAHFEDDEITLGPIGD